MTPHHGDETSSTGVFQRPQSEGEGVARSLRQINLYDPQSPSSATAGSSIPAWHKPRKRPSNSTLPEADERAAKWYNRVRSGPDPVLGRSMSQTGPNTTASNFNRASASPHLPSRPLTPRTNNPSPLGQRNAGPQSGSPGRLEGKHADIYAASDLLTQDSSVPGNMVKQVSTTPITQDQLINEVKGTYPKARCSHALTNQRAGIYAGLVPVEKKCVEIDQQQAASNTKLNNQQYQALIALHRTLLHEHHDFFLASQHPSAGVALNKLATKYAMPARMWRHGIHSFLELLRHRLPESLEHMLAFVYLAYSMMALLMESVPSFEETWIECLGDLARYRMAIEEADLRDRETWAGVARMWYNRAADKSPGVGRIQHHLAVLARPNIVQQLFYYSKALVSVTPFQNARESIMLLFNQFLEPNEVASQRYPKVESLFVKAHGILFVRGSVMDFDSLVMEFGMHLDSHIGRTTAKYREQGPEMAAALCAGLFDFGHGESHLTQLFLQQRGKQSIPQGGASGVTTTSETSQHQQLAAVRGYWTQHGYRSSTHPGANPAVNLDPAAEGPTFANSDQVVFHALKMFHTTMDVAFSRIGDKNVLSFAHVTLAFIWSLAFVPGALEYVQGYVPWSKIAVFLNTLGRHGATRADSLDSPQIGSSNNDNHRRPQLPEDFVMRGLIWSEFYFPAEFFSGSVLGEDERALEMPSHTVYRAERCLWLGLQLSSVSKSLPISRHKLTTLRSQLNHWLRYEKESKQFSATGFTHSLPRTLDDTDDRSSTEPSETATAPVA